mmetsp:Transcript_2928/g.8050  ORF Transcript_2928/g.8050 Transcript_2928/m.8050 type:complete len:497 (-) Transcript_2928:433-1923(-)
MRGPPRPDQRPAASRSAQALRGETGEGYMPHGDSGPRESERGRARKNSEKSASPASLGVRHARAHRDELLRSRGVHPDGGIEVRLGRASLEAHASELDDLARVGAHHVHAQHLVRGAVHHQLHQRLLLAASEGVLHAAEAGAVDVHHATLGAGGLLRQAHGTDGRVAEDGRGDVRVVGLARLAAEEGVGEAVALGQRNGGERHAVDHVAHRVDAGNGGLEGLVNDDGAVARVQLHAGLLAAEPLGAGPAPRGEHDDVGLNGAGAAGRQAGPGQRGAQAAAGQLLDGRDGGAEAKVDALRAVLRRQVLAHVPVEAAQPHVAAVQHRHVGAVALEDARELHRDVAAAYDDDALGPLREEEGLVGGDGEIRPRDVGLDRPAAHGHEDLVRRVPLAGHLHRVRVDERRAAGEHLHAPVLEHVGVDPVQARDLLVLVGDEAGPVKTFLFYIPPVGGGVVDVMRKVCAIHHKFLRNTTHVHASPAEPPIPSIGKTTSLSTFS